MDKTGIRPVAGAAHVLLEPSPLYANKYLTFTKIFIPSTISTRLITFVPLSSKLCFQDTSHIFLPPPQRSSDEAREGFLFTPHGKSLPLGARYTPNRQFETRCNEVLTADGALGNTETNGSEINSLPKQTCF